MATLQEKLKSRLLSLKELNNVKVEVTDKLGKITISHRRYHVADFEFRWVGDNHYVGYFVSAGGKRSQAIVSIRKPLEAVKFIVLYCTLVELRANVKRK